MKKSVYDDDDAEFGEYGKDRGFDMTALRQRAHTLLDEVPESNVQEIITYIINVTNPIEKTGSRLGAGGEDFQAPDDIDFCNDEIAELFCV